jgi:cell division inhibitor SulA
MRSLGRFLQIAGLAILPLASVMQLSNSITVGTMMQMLGAGICVFLIGWILVTYR